MRAILLSALAALSLTAGAQTYFYVDQISVQPANPTTADVIVVDLTGNFAGGGVSVVNTAISFQGNQVDITINCVDNGGITVLVPHTETVNLGTLSVGTYTIALNGTGLGDFAPTPQHQFTVTGNGACDSLLFNSITWAPFSDTAIVVTVSNQSSTLFDYPGFVLLDGMGDTLARETVNYFGIGQGPQTHILSVFPGATIPPSPFAGTLDLWTLFYTAFGCSFSEPIDLCPPAPCASLIVDIGNFGGAIVIGSFDYTVVDGGGNVVASGTLTLDNLNQFTQDTVCVPPGAYEVRSSNPGAFGGSLTYGVGQALIAGPHEQYMQNGIMNTLPFNFFPACTNGTNGLVENPVGIPPTIQTSGDALIIIAPDGLPLGHIEILDASGRVLHRSTSQGTNLELAMAAYPPGVLLVRCDRNDGTSSVARVVNIR